MAWLDMMSLFIFEERLLNSIATTHIFPDKLRMLQYAEDVIGKAEDDIDVRSLEAKRLGQPSEVAEAVRKPSRLSR